MAQKTEFQNFTTDWQKTAAWAQDQGIAAKSFMPIYQQDAAHLLQNGTSMSQAERTRAVRAAAGLGVTQLPQDNPNPSDVFGNTMKNAEQIFTGLNPIGGHGIVANLFHTVENTFTHPMESVVNPIIDLAKLNSVDFFNKQSHDKDMKQFSSSVLGNASPLAFVPGVVDAAHLMQGKAGVKYLASNPLTSVLDVLPIGKLTGGTVARIGGNVAAETASRAGVTVAELKKMSAGQLAWRITKNSKVPFKQDAKHLTNLRSATTKEFTTAYKDQTIGEFVSSLRNHIGAGAEQSDLLKAIKDHEKVGQQQMMDILRPFNGAWAKLDRNSTLKVNDYFSTQYHFKDFRPNSQILNDPKFTEDERDAMRQTIKLDHWFTKQKLNAGELKWVRTASGMEIYLASGSRAAAVEAAAAKVTAATDALHAGALKMNILMTKTQEADGQMMGAFDQIGKYRDTLYSNLQSSLPDLAQGNKTYDTLTSALPKDRRPGLFGARRSNVDPAGKQNLETFLGLDEKVEKRVYRGAGKDAVPFSGKQATWSQAELAAFEEAKKMADKLPPGAPRPSNASIVKLAEKRLQITSTIHQVRVHAPVPWQTADIISQLVSPGGILDQAIQAFDNQEFEQLHALAAAAKDKLSNKSFHSPTRSEALDRLDNYVNVLAQYAETRDKATRQIMSMWEGKTKEGKTVRRGTAILTAKRNSVASLVAALETANKEFLDTSEHNPPSIWENYKQKEFTRQLMKREEGKQLAQQAVKALRRKGMDKVTLKDLKSNPEVLTEMTGLSAIASLANHMLPNVDPEVAAEVTREAESVIADLRAKGMKPLYLPTTHPFERVEGTAGQVYNVTMGRTSIKREQVSFERAIDGINATVYDFQAGMNKAVREYVTRSHEIDFQEHEMQQFVYNRSDVLDIINSHFGPEMKASGIIPEVPGGPRSGNYSAFVEAKLTQWGLKNYDPTSIFSTGNPKVVAGVDQLIHKDIEHGLSRSFNRLGSNFLMKNYDKATGLFRTSILGYSLRFTAHIVLGGTMLLAGKSSPQALRGIGDAWRMTKAFTHGQAIPEDILSKYNLTSEDITTDKVFTHNSLQEGVSDLILRSTMGFSAAQFSIQENIAKMFGKEAADLKHPDWFTHYLKVIPEMNYRLTRFSTNMQRSVSLFDGLRQANRKEHFFMDEWDEQAKKVVRTRYEMGPEQVVQDAMEHVDRVMGDVNNMTPIEFNYLTRVFPFWSWTNHVLHYVLQYPGDHPYRAMFLSQMARISNQETPAGLPLRSQLLFFLGNPDQSGNVSAIDMRAANPLRDTAQYFSLTGWLSALNPVITAPFAKVDPSITFGTNVLYPNISYSSLYGSNEAQASGTWLAGVEGIVPEVSSLDAALNLSGQYAYLQKGDRNAYIKKVFEGVGFPWLPQHLNLNQIKATNELDRYNQARAAAGQAWKTGDFSGLAGYGKVPDPRNTQYDITPAELQTVYNQSAAALGPNLQPGEVQAASQRLPNPTY